MTTETVTAEAEPARLRVFDPDLFPTREAVGEFIAGPEYQAPLSSTRRNP